MLLEFPVISLHRTADRPQRLNPSSIYKSQHLCVNVEPQLSRVLEDRLQHPLRRLKHVSVVRLDELLHEYQVCSNLVDVLILDRIWLVSSRSL